MSFEELTAPDLVKKWKQVVNDHVAIGRDAKLIKNLLDSGITPVQVLHGMYQFERKGNVSIPIFVRIKDDWLEEDEEWAKIELACCLAKQKPMSYYIVLENEDSEFYEQRSQAVVAKQELLEWTERVLG